MKLHRLIAVAGLLMMTTVGCCHSQCVSSNPCDPCGGGCGGGGCCLSGWLQTKLANCRLRHNYSWCNDCSSGCSVCGGENCGMNSDMGMGVPSTGGSTCGCGQSHGSGTYVPSSPNTDAAPAPIPTQVAPVPPKSGEPTPAPGASDSTTNFQRPTGQIQHVSVEEFQRLPGVVISGPAQSSVPTMAQPTLAPPVLSTVSAPPKPATTVQQAQWVPAKQ